MRVNIQKTIIIFIFLFLNISAFSHPHVFIENAFTFIFDDNNLSGIRIKWIFDEMFSASIIMDFDSNRNNIFEENEIKEVEQGAFSNLANYNYYLYITIDNTKFSISEIKDFKAEITDNRIVYYFFIPLNIKAEKNRKKIQTGCYDNTYFCYVFNSEIEPVKLENNSHFECSWEIIEDKKNVYWVTIIPKVVALKFRIRNE